MPSVVVFAVMKAHEVSEEVQESAAPPAKAAAR